MRRYLQVTKDSLRGRLLAGTLAWILLSVVVAGLGLSDLFSQHVSRQFEDTLNIHLNQLIAAFSVEKNGIAVVSPALSDPRFEQPLSGLYWQIDRLEPGASSVSGILQSRSLWDQTLVLPSSTPVRGRAHYYEIAGPENNVLAAIERTVLPSDGDAAFRLIVAADQQALVQSIRQFQHMLLISLGILAAGLTLAAVTQVWVGLRPLALLHRRLIDVNKRKTARIEGQFPSEIQPLVDNFNQVLTANEEIILRARTHAGNLAHAVKTPLTVIANAAAHETSEFGQLVRDQVSIARQQIDHHLARARAAAAEQASEGNVSLSTPLSDTLEALVRVLRILYVDRKLTIILSDTPKSLTFRGEAQDLHEILGNILDNACKWAKSIVQVRVESMGTKLQITIEDDGPGLSAEQYAQVFKRGVRMDELKPGSGLGLSIVKDLVEAYGGTVQADCSLLGGLCVRLLLPVAATSA